MSLGDLNTIVVTATYRYIDDTPARGNVTFTWPSTLGAIQDPVSNLIIVPKPITVALDAIGHFSVTLPASDDPDVTPTGFTYHVVENIQNVGPFAEPREYDITIPVGAAGGTIDLADVAPVAVLGGTYTFASQADLQALAARVFTLEQGEINEGSGGGGGGNYNPPIPITDVSGLQTALDSKANTSQLSGFISSSSPTITGTLNLSGNMVATGPIRIKSVPFSGGAPPTGTTYATHDILFDTTSNNLYMCTAGGNPGAWAYPSAIVIALVQQALQNQIDALPEIYSLFPQYGNFTSTASGMALDLSPLAAGTAVYDFTTTPFTLSSTDATNVSSETPLQMALDANQRYEIRGTIFYVATAGPVTLGWSIPSGAGGLYSVIGLASSATTSPGTIIRGAAGFASTFDIGIVPSPAIASFDIVADIATSVTAGTLAMRLAKNLTGTTATLSANSFLKVTPMN